MTNVEHYYLNDTERPCDAGYYHSEFCPEHQTECHTCGFLFLKADMLRRVDPVMGTCEWFVCSEQCERDYDPTPTEPEDVTS